MWAMKHSPQCTITKARNGFVIEWVNQRWLEEWNKLRHNMMMSMHYDPVPATEGVTLALTTDELQEWLLQFFSLENTI